MSLWKKNNPEKYSKVSVIRIKETEEEGIDNTSFIHGGDEKVDIIEEIMNNKDEEGQTNTKGIKDGKKTDLLYSVDDVPPWHICIILGFQHYLTAMGGSIILPILMAKHLCLDGDGVGLGELISTVFFVSGLGTLLQTTMGVRLPIVQGATAAFLTPTIVLLSQPHWKCPYLDVENGKINITDLPEYGSVEHKELWHARLCEGSLMIAAMFQVVIGYSGLLGPVLKYIGPLAITPTISLIGLSVFGPVADLASKQWYIAMLTVFLITLFSQYLGKIYLPICNYEKGKGCGMYKLPVFKLFPVLLAMIVSWIVCVILTATNVFPKNTNEWGYFARTDTKISVLYDSQWFRFPYPGQWGMPTASAAGIFGMLAGVLASMVESVGDYYACARLSGAPPPPVYAINRGSGTEGIVLIISGAWGSGAGFTSYSENIGAIGVTKVGSRRVVQAGGIIMLILACLGKFGALFVTIPDPVIGGVLLVTLGLVGSVGLSNLHYVDLTSSRNIFILGISLFLGLTVPLWIKDHSDSINTGSVTVNQLLSVLLSTSMFVGGLVGFILDNTIPGTDEERGLTKWRQVETSTDDPDVSIYKTYELPFVQKYIDRIHCTRFIPFCATFIMDFYCRCCCAMKRSTESKKTGIRSSEQNTQSNYYEQNTPL